MVSGCEGHGVVAPRACAHDRDLGRRVTRNVSTGGRAHTLSARAWICDVNGVLVDTVGLVFEPLVDFGVQGHPSSLAANLEVAWGAAKAKMDLRES